MEASPVSDTLTFLLFEVVVSRWVITVFLLVLLLVLSMVEKRGEDRGFCGEVRRWSGVVGAKGETVVAAIGGMGEAWG